MLIVDIWRELTEISVANYGWELRIPARDALGKLYHLRRPQNPDSIVGYSFLTLDKMGDDFRKDLVLKGFKTSNPKGFLIERDFVHSSLGDDAILEFFTTTKGYRIKASLYDALKNLCSGDYTDDILEFSEQGPVQLLIAGNNFPMFKPYYIVTSDDYGIDFEGTVDGVGRLNEDETYSITMTVENIYTGTTYSETITRDDKLYNTEHITFFTDNSLTYCIDPGMLRITVDDGESNPHGTIKTRVCKFGMTPAIGVFPTDDSDYTFYEGNDHSETISYIGEPTELLMPTTLGNQPLTLIGGYTFYKTDVEKVIIPEGVETIE